MGYKNRPVKEPTTFFKSYLLLFVTRKRITIRSAPRKCGRMVGEKLFCAFGWWYYPWKPSFSCRIHDRKWVSLMLWVGADPCAKGPDPWHEDPDPENDQNALELAAGYEHFDVFNLKRIHLDRSKPELKNLLQEACHAEKSDFLKKLLEKGFNPGEFENKGSSLIRILLADRGWCFDFDRWDPWRTERWCARGWGVLG